MYKIVILDGYALNPGDLDYSPLAEFGELTVYDRSTPSEVLERARDADMIIGNKILIGASEFEKLPNLKYIGVQATGYNVIDVAAARMHGVTVTNVPAYSTSSVAQLTFAHLLNLSFHLSEHTSEIRNGAWVQNPDFTYWNHPLMELAGKTIGLIGFGSIGKKVAQIALAFDMKVLAARKHAANNVCNDKNVGSDGMNDRMNVEIVSIDDVFRRSDVVSLHCPATPETVKLVNSTRLALMKRTAFLINTARGVLVDEQALADALNSNQISGAGLDVLSVEPPTANNPLLTARNCFCTAHIAWATRAARERCLEVVIQNVRAFLEGRPTNVVS